MRGHQHQLVALRVLDFSNALDDLRVTTRAQYFLSTTLYMWMVSYSNALPGWVVVAKTNLDIVYVFTDLRKPLSDFGTDKRITRSRITFYDVLELLIEIFISLL
jgi:hypothetical protein